MPRLDELRSPRPTAPSTGATVSLDDCLPSDLRRTTTTVTRIAVGLSGADVFRVEAAGQAYVLKVSGQDEPLADWRRRFQVQKLAARAGLAPQVVHVDEDRRAILSAFAGDQSFPALYGDPRTREAAVALLGRTLRRVHDLPLPPGLPPSDPRKALAASWAGLPKGFAVPSFVRDAVERVRTEPPPPADRAPVLSHNDVNPSNLLYDGENLLLVDWDHAGPNDPYFDLASIAVFLRMDEASCLTLLAAHDGEPVSTVPAGFDFNRRVMAALCGTTFLRLARDNGHGGARVGETLESATSLGEFYQRMRAGDVSLATAEGQWSYGLALVKESLA
jgi:aminoglycoside phosphotransferase (APT) family kinase protein